ncbi:MAG: type II secretion system protein M [Gammaproteobacteria bacterium]|nr:type II secretion system protein M [Gammaproteobacteria bacterium]
MSAFAQVKQKFMTWFKGLSDSEQKLLKVAFVFFGIFIFYSTISGLNAGVKDAENKLAQQVKLNSWAEQQIAIITSANGSGKAGNTSQGSMTQIINTTARRLSITIDRIQPQKTDLVKVGIDEIGFNTLMTWLQTLQVSHGITAKNIDFTKSETSGLVNIRRLDLERL